MIDPDILTELRKRLSAALPHGYSSSLYTNDGGAVVTVADLFDVEWGVPFFVREVRRGREEIERAIDEAADAASQRKPDTRRLSRRRLLAILGPHRDLPIGYAYDAYECAGLVALVASKILAWRPPRGEPVAVYVQRDTPEWRADVRAALRAALPDIEAPPREVADATAEDAASDRAGKVALGASKIRVAEPIEREAKR